MIDSSVRHVWLFLPMLVCLHVGSAQPEPDPIKTSPIVDTFPIKRATLEFHERDDGHRVISVRFRGQSGRYRLPVPRVDGVTTYGFTPDGHDADGNPLAKVALAVYGANIDTKCVVLIKERGGEQTESIGEQTESIGEQTEYVVGKTEYVVGKTEYVVEKTEYVDGHVNSAVAAMEFPTTLGYPIYVYTTFKTSAESLKMGVSYDVSVLSWDRKQKSEPRTYTVPASASALDSDGDGLPDDIELGYLEPLGADPMVKDIFLEVDWMNHGWPVGEVVRAASVKLRDVFESAPVYGPSGDRGIRLHVSSGQPGPLGRGGGQEIAQTTLIGFDPRLKPGDPEDPEDHKKYTRFEDVRKHKLAEKRKGYFRYCVIALKGQVAGRGRARGGDFYAATYSEPDVDRLFQTMLHELGHTFGLWHGGDIPHCMYKPNYNSIMNYLYTWEGVDNDCEDCGPDKEQHDHDGYTDHTIAHPKKKDSPDPKLPWQDHVVFPGGDGVYTFSEGMLADLDESKLNEADGICGRVWRDWNRDREPSADEIQLSLTPCTDLCTEGGGEDYHVLKDYADWAGMDLALPAE